MCLGDIYISVFTKLQWLLRITSSVLELQRIRCLFLVTFCLV